MSLAGDVVGGALQALDFPDRKVRRLASHLLLVLLLVCPGAVFAAVAANAKAEASSAEAAAIAAWCASDVAQASAARSPLAGRSTPSILAAGGVCRGTHPQPWYERWSTDVAMPPVRSAARLTEDGVTAVLNLYWQRINPCHRPPFGPDGAPALKRAGCTATSPTGGAS